jgi:hypothetical protein
MRLEAQYTTISSWDLTQDLEALGITSDDVVDYWVKWDQLTIVYRDKHGELCNLFIGQPQVSATDSDFKHPDSVEEVVEEF